MGSWKRLRPCRLGPTRAGMSLLRVTSGSLLHGLDELEKATMSGWCGRGIEMRRLHAWLRMTWRCSCEFWQRSRLTEKMSELT